jgi:hypothetical protein
MIAVLILVPIKDGTVPLKFPTLLRDAKKYAAQHGIPLRQVFEQGLQIVVNGSNRPRRRFRLKTVTTKGDGLAIDGNWSTIRSMIYEGHGG